MLILRSRRFCAAAAIVGVLVVSLGALVLVHRTRVPDTSFASTFRMPFVSYEGTTVRLASFRRTKIVVYSWASWCPYCAAELQELGRAKQQYGKEFQVVAINRGESLADARTFTSKLAGTQDIIFLLDPDDQFYKAIGGFAMPEGMFINPGGEVVLHQRGPMTEDTIRSAFK